MEIKDLVSKTRAIRDLFHESLELLINLDGQIKDFSFTHIIKQIPEIGDVFDDIFAIGKSERISGEMAPDFVCAFIGNSNSGKSSILEGLFPDLAQRGWLPTQAKDTTSQAIRIRSASLTNDPNQVVICPWSIHEITTLVNRAGVSHKSANIVVRTNPDSVEIDGTDSFIDSNIKSLYKFGLRQTLKAFSNPYTIPASEANNEHFIRHLITKVDSSVIDTHWNLMLGDSRFHSLQLRASVKFVDVFDPFTKILHWSGQALGEFAQNITFIDSPGLKTSGSQNDEILAHTLAHKNEQTVAALLKDDELDVIINITLIPDSSSLSDLLARIRESYDGEEFDDIHERLIIAINGFHRYCTLADLTRVRTDRDSAQKEGDHFSTTIESNILNKLGLHRSIKPAAIIFVDSKRHTEAAFQNKNYEEIYKGIKAEMIKCAISTEIGYDTLSRLNMLGYYHENLDHLCNPDDCGQGFLVKQVLSLIKKNGPKYYIRKFIKKSKLISSIKQLRELLLDYYDITGRLNSKNILTSVNLCLIAIDKNDPLSIDKFCKMAIDKRLATIDFTVPVDKSSGWIKESFRITCRWLLDYILLSSKIRLKNENRELTADDRLIFTKYFTNLINKWVKDWGYLRTPPPVPTPQDLSSGEQVRHALYFHVREIVYQLLNKDPDNQGLEKLFQSDSDQKIIKDVLDKLKISTEQSEILFRQYGVVSI